MVLTPLSLSVKAATINHELTHVWWIGPTNEESISNLNEIPEEYGMMECAELAWNCGSPIANNHLVVLNADTYAHYLEYAFFTQSLGDMWPEDKKPVKLPVTYA